jgi:sugar phosphate isomerase/epimerase
MELGICSYSYHRLLKAGQHDLFKYILDCKELGCTQLDPWNGHMAALKGESEFLGDAEEKFMADAEEAADVAGLPWGTIAVDGHTHIYEPTEEARRANRLRAYRWLNIAGTLGFEQVRIDAGGPEEMPDESFRVIVAGYEDLIARAKPLGIQVLFENHFGPTIVPDNCVKLCESVEGLAMLLDTHNFKPELRDQGRRKCARYAAATHVKTFNWDASGKEVTPDEKVEEAIKVIMDSGYKGVWGVESTPADGDERGGARRTVDLIRRTVTEG